MKFASHLLLTAAAFSAFGSAALAADPASVDAPYVASDWSGFYAGLHGGFGSSVLLQMGQDVLDNVSRDPDIDELSLFPSIGDETGYAPSGALAGGQAGALWQTGMFVLGVQGDVSWTGMSSTSIYLGDVNDDPILTGSVDWLATLTGRAGVVVDRVMIYGLAGLAVAGVNIHEEDESVDATFTGYTVGAGAALQLDAKWSVWGEYALSGFGEQTIDLPDHNSSRIYDFGLSTFKVGVNYKF